MRILDLVIKDFQDRAEVGKTKYGRYLEAGNGRDAMLDLLQELMDGVMYCRQWLLEQELKSKDDICRKIIL